LQKQSAGTFKPVKQKIFVIVGLGLIGGSLAVAIQRRIRSVRVIGVSRSSKRIALAKKKKLIHEGFTQIRSAVRNADFVLICSPVDAIPKLVSEVDRYAKIGTIVTDVGSAKGEIVRWAGSKHFRKIEFVGSHPLAGSHLTGLEHAKKDLFEKAFVFVTPSRKSSPRTVRTVSQFWKKLGTRVILLSPEKHDQIVSQISHLPHAIASSLMHVVSPNSIRYGASGFRDTTRVAQGDPGLWAPIFLTNRTNLVKDLRHFEKALRKLILLLQKRSEKSLRNFLRIASLKRN